MYTVRALVNSVFMANKSQRKSGNFATDLTNTLKLTQKEICYKKKKTSRLQKSIVDDFLEARFQSLSQELPEHLYIWNRPTLRELEFYSDRVTESLLRGLYYLLSK